MPRDDFTRDTGDRIFVSQDADFNLATIWHSIFDQNFAVIAGGKGKGSGILTVTRFGYADAAAQVGRLDKKGIGKSVSDSGAQRIRVAL